MYYNNINMVRKYVNVRLEEETIRHLDEYAKKVNRSRKQFIELTLEKIVQEGLTEKDYLV